MMAPNIIRSEAQYWGREARRMFAGLHAGIPTKRLPGGWIGDLADLKKAIVLCPSCYPKFNIRAAGYVLKKNVVYGTNFVVTGSCDGCKDRTAQGQLCVHHTLANLT